MKIKNLEQEIDFLRQQNADLQKQLATSTSEYNARIALLEEELRKSQKLLQNYSETELSLKSSEAELLALFNAIQDIILIIDAEGRYLKVAPSSAPSLYKPPVEIIGKTAHDIFPSALADSFQECIQKALQTRQMVKIEYSLPIANQDVWFEASIAPMNENGVVCVARDISDRKAAEAALREQETLYRKIFETVSDGISLIDLESINIVSVNPAFAQMHGYSPEEFIQLHPTEFIHPDCFNLLEEFINTIKTGGEFYHQAMDIRKDGTPFDIEVTGRLLDFNGKPHGLSVVRDISDRKQAEKELRRFLAILEATTDVVGMADAEGNNFYLNKAGQDILGIPATDIDKFHISEFLTPLMLEKFQAEGLPTVIKKGIWSGESVFLSCHGEEIPVSQVIIAHKNEKGEVEFLSTIARDIRDRLQIEAQLRQQTQDLAQTLEELQHTQSQMIQAEKMSSLGQLVAGVAHEINNPVNFIHGNLSHLEEHIQDLLRIIDSYQSTPPLDEDIDLEYIQEDVPKILSSMKVGTQRIRQIVLSLRTFSRMDEAEFKAINIHEGIDSTLMILQHRLKEKPEFPAIHVIKNYGNLPLVECYGGQLNQVFMNILTNAIDALETVRKQHEHPTITICTSLIDAAWLKIAIADNGTGMPEQIQKQVFNPFFTTKPVGKGTGMGMSISYQIITEKHGGKLECNSTPGKGTEFVIEIPIRHE